MYEAGHQRSDLHLRQERSYTYAANDPANLIDPSGNSPLAENLMTVALVGALAGGLYGGIQAGRTSGWNPQAIVAGTLTGAVAGFVAPFVVVYAGAFLAQIFGVSLATGILLANTMLFTYATQQQLAALEAAKSDGERIEIFATLLLSAAFYGLGVANFYSTEIAPASLPPATLATGSARTAEIRALLPIGKDRNVGYAKYNIDGETGELIAVSGPAPRAGTVTVPTDRRFVTVATGRNDRTTDSEVKILEHLAARLRPNSTGTVDLYSELEPCISCNGVINQFRVMFPGVKVNVTWGP